MTFPPFARAAARGAGAIPAADILSGLRFIAAILWVWLFLSGYRGVAGLGAIAIAAAASDILDGWVARWTATSRDAGRWLDNLADITFVLVTLGCEAWAGALPVYIPILIALSFAQYAIDSIVTAASARAPIPSRLGHWGGILNFALVIALALSPPPGWLGAIVQDIAPAIAVFYLAAIGERVVSYFR